MEIDQRDTTTWVVLELTSQGEQKQEDGTLYKSIRNMLDVPDTFPVFVPCTTYTSGGSKVVVHLMEGYVFVASGLPEPKYFSLEGSAIVRKVLTAKGQHGMRTLVCIPDKDIRALRTQLQNQVASDLLKDMAVRIVDGPYKGLEGVITEVCADHAVVWVALRSLELFTLAPKSFIVPIDMEGGS